MIMSARQIATAILIHLFFPALGLFGFVVLCRRLSSQGVSRIFFAELFLLFVAYGGWLLVLLTALFWQWSGMASLGLLFLVFGAPTLLLPVTIHCLRRSPDSTPHRRAYWASIGYYFLLLTIVGVSLLVFHSRQ